MRSHPHTQIPFHTSAMVEHALLPLHLLFFFVFFVFSGSRVRNLMGWESEWSTEEWRLQEQQFAFFMRVNYLQF